MATCIYCANGKHGKCVKRNRGGCPGNCQHRWTRHALNLHKPKPEPVVATPLVISAAEHQQEHIGMPNGVSVGAGMAERTGMDPSAMERNGAFEAAPEREWISIPSKHLDRMITAYVARVETDPTEERCRCPWDEVYAKHGTRKVRRNDHPNCSIHSKEGFIKGFFEYLVIRNVL